MADETVPGTDLIRAWLDDAPIGLTHNPNMEDSGEPGATTFNVDWTVCGDYVGCLDYRSNRKVLEDEFPELVATMHYGYGATDAIVTLYPSQDYDADDVREFLATLEGLAEYPILDDDAANQEVEDVASETWERDTLPDIIRHVDAMLEDAAPPYMAPNVEALVGWWLDDGGHETCYYDARHVEYNSVYWDADDIAANVVADATREQDGNGVPPLYVLAPWADPTNPIFSDADSFGRRVSAWDRTHLSGV